MKKPSAPKPEAFKRRGPLPALKLYLPPDLQAYIRTEAERNLRSMTRQAEAMLRYAQEAAK